VLSFVKSCCISVLEGKIVNVETDVTPGIPFFELVGVMNTIARDSRERVRAAIRNSGFKYPQKKILVNISPADLRKEGPYFDLAIAIGILAASKQIIDNFRNNYIFFGELSLDGSLKSVRGVLPMIIEAKRHGFKGVILPMENAKEASIIKGIRILPARNLKDAVCICENVENSTYDYKNNESNDIKKSDTKYYDFKDVIGQAYAKRALEVAAAGGHNILMVGAPGSGKTMMAKRMLSILPPLTYEEALETTIVHSIAGIIPGDGGLIWQRPFRSPLHTSTVSSIVGGGRYPKPGEISLAHNGVLFLDEITLFRCDVLEALRQPLQEGCVTIHRHNGVVTYPASFMLIAAANPCKCGNLLEKDKECTCSLRDIASYQNKLSGAISDRIDIKIEVTSTNLKDMHQHPKEESSEIIKNRVENARKIQLQRYKGTNIFCNSAINKDLVWKACKLDRECEDFVNLYCKHARLSTRAYISLLKVARTIADLDNNENIEKKHLAEAFQYKINFSNKKVV
jgi:magnesium chelatase family protein